MKKTKYISVLLCFVVCAAVGASFSARGFGVIKYDAPTVQASSFSANEETEATVLENETASKATAQTTSEKAETRKAKKAESSSKKESTSNNESTSQTETKSETASSKSELINSQRSAKKKIKNSKKKKSTKKKKKSKKKKTKKVTTTTTTTAPSQKQTDCTVTINCSAATPSSPYAVKGYNCSYKTGDTAYDILERTCKANNIEMNAKSTAYGLYVYSINNIDEDFLGYKKGGWMYKVNGNVPMKSIDKYELQKGDSIEFYYGKVS